MKTTIILFLMVLFLNNSKKSVESAYEKANVSYGDFEHLVRQVKLHREKRLLSFNDFIEKSKEPNVIILDSRSKNMYERKHIKGARHLNFSDFTESNLAALINTPILIYCNNNFTGDEINFMSKSIKISNNKKIKELTLALNIPTYINLYGYGYKNIYELDELITPLDSRVEFEGTIF